MPLTISHPVTTPVTTGQTAAPAASPAASGAPLQATSTAQQQAALRQMLTKYAYDQSHGTAASTLTALGKQIQAAAKALGQHVTLPRASAAPATEATTATTSALPNKGKVSVTV